jgi:hypothetical protein
MLHERRQAASVLLRYHRDKEYAALLQQQKAQRTELCERQRQGLPTYRLSDGTTPIERGNAKAHSRHAQIMAKAHGETPLAPDKGTTREQFRAAAKALCSATDIVSSVRQEEESKQRQWRQQRVTSHSATHEPIRERQAAVRAATEGAQQRKEYEDQVRRTWNRARPAPGRGRD